LLYSLHVIDQSREEYKQKALKKLTLMNTVMTVIFTVISTGALLIQLIMCLKRLWKKRKTRAVGAKKYEQKSAVGLAGEETKATEE